MRAGGPKAVLRLPPPTPAVDGSDTFNILNWRVFGPGYRKQELYSPERVARIVANYRALKSANPDYAPRVKLGHDKQQRLAKSLGLPNVGRVPPTRQTPTGGGNDPAARLDDVVIAHFPPALPTYPNEM